MKTAFSNIPSAHELHFRKRELILRAQDPLDFAFFIKNGYVRHYTITNSGQELTLSILKKGDIFPLEIFLHSENSSHFYEALNKAILLRANTKKVLSEIYASDDAIESLHLAYVTRFYGVLERMQYLAFGSAYGKVASILAICAERFGEIVSKNQILIKAPLTHSDIASLVGLARETVSIEMKKIEEKGYISYTKRSRICVKSIARLRSHAMKET